MYKDVFYANTLTCLKSCGNFLDYFFSSHLLHSISPITYLRVQHLTHLNVIQHGNFIQGQAFPEQGTEQCHCS